MAVCNSSGIKEPVAPDQRPIRGDWLFDSELLQTATTLSRQSSSSAASMTRTSRQLNLVSPPCRRVATVKAVCTYRRSTTSQSSIVGYANVSLRPSEHDAVEERSHIRRRRELARRFEQALATPNDAGLRALFRPDCHWCDVLALTWTIHTLDGRDTVVSALKPWAARARPKGFRYR